MAKPREFVLLSEIGQRFALNFYHCWNTGIFEDTAAVEELLKSWWDECLLRGKTAAPDEALNLLASKIKGLSGKPANIRRIALSRVVSFTAFFSPPTSSRSADYSLLKSKYVTDTYGVTLKTSLTSDVFKKLERINGDTDAVRPGALVRGQMPLSWATSTDSFESERVRYQPDYSGDFALRICRLLGLEGRFYYNAPLFQLNYPASVSRDNYARRPTALEGAGNRYFRARRDGEYRNNFGYTVDLERFEASELDVDGVIEVIVPTLDFSDEFTWRGIGFLLSDTTPTNETDFKSRLSRNAVSVVLIDASSLIDGICL